MRMNVTETTERKDSWVKKSVSAVGDWISSQISYNAKALMKSLTWVSCVQKKTQPFFHELLHWKIRFFKGWLIIARKLSLRMRFFVVIYQSHLYNNLSRKNRGVNACTIYLSPDKANHVSKQWCQRFKFWAKIVRYSLFGTYYLSDSQCQLSTLIILTLKLWWTEGLNCQIRRSIL